MMLYILKLERLNIPIPTAPPALSPVVIAIASTLLICMVSNIPTEKKLVKPNHEYVHPKGIPKALHEYPVMVLMSTAKLTNKGDILKK
jgi:hypothetical protein